MTFLETIKKKKYEISLIKEHFSYDKETGVIRWKKAPHYTRPFMIGKKAGHVDIRGRIIITLKRKIYFGHNVAWVITYGHFPSELDHINGIPGDNRIENLRECTRAQNMANTKANRKGVTRFSRNKIRPFRAKIRHNGEDIYLPYRKTREEAEKDYERMHKKLKGKFSYFNRPKAL